MKMLANLLVIKHSGVVGAVAKSMKKAVEELPESPKGEKEASEAVQRLFELKTRGACMGLAILLASRNKHFKKAAERNPDLTVNMMEELFMAGNAEVQITAVKALEAIGSNKAVEVLARQKEIAESNVWKYVKQLDGLLKGSSAWEAANAKMMGNMGVSKEIEAAVEQITTGGLKVGMDEKEVERIFLGED